MSEIEKPVIIIKRVTKRKHTHGGSWKIAYADFVTAMMAFFMLMWMLSMLNKFQLAGISNYFKKPMKDIFLENQLHNTDVPKVPSEHTEKSELAPMKTKKDGFSKKKEKVHSTYRPKDNYGPINQKTEADGKGQTVVKSVKVQEKGTPIPTQPEAQPNQQLSQPQAQPQAQPQTQAPPQPQPQTQTETQTKQAEKQEFENLKKVLENSLNKDPNVNKYKELLNFKITDEGLKIEITSLKNKPMFSKGDVDFEKYASNIMLWLTKELNKTTPRKITIIGHTDSDLYMNPTKYSNWELSADRANATRRLLIKAGMDRKRFIRVQGAGSSTLLIKDDGRNPANRRIEIIILSDEAANRFLNE